MSTNKEETGTASPSDVRMYDDGTCAICLSSHVNKATPDCGHVFCFRCLIDWCQIKLECPTCKQPFQNFRHNIQIRPTCEQIYTPDTPLVPADQQPTPEVLNITFLDGGELQTWVVRTPNRMIVLLMPPLTHERLHHDTNFQTWFFNYLNSQLNINIVGMVWP
jgi:E3 ubiquitin-protein ligase Topors